MGETASHPNVIRRLAPGGHVVPFRAAPERRELTPELQKYLHILGPTPKRCLEILADLGMSDVEIGRYFRMPCRLVAELRHIWNIDGNA